MAMTMTPTELHDLEQPFITIPIRGTQDSVQIYHEELPEDALEMMDLLQAEVAELFHWLRAAVEYYRQGKKNQFRMLLNSIMDTLKQHPDPEYEQMYKNDKVGRLRILVALAVDAVKEATTSTSRQLREDWYAKAQNHITDADRVDTQFELTWLAKGLYHLGHRTDDQCKYAMNSANSSPSTMSLCGLAAYHFSVGEYDKALRNYSEALMMNPGCPASVRVGMGMCAYKLGQVTRARACFSRALKLDPGNAPARVGLAITDLASITNPSDPAQANKMEIASGLLSEALQQEPSNPMALNHLAHQILGSWMASGLTVQVRLGSDVAVCDTNLRVALPDIRHLRVGDHTEVQLDWYKFDGHHIPLPKPWSGPTNDSMALYFKDLNKVVNMAQEAMEVTMVNEVKGESCLVLGQVHHLQGEMNQAKGLYDQALQLSPKLVLARYGLAQLAMAERDWNSAVRHLKAVLEPYPRSHEALFLLGVAHLQAQQHKDAMAAFRRAVDVQPAMAEAWLSLAQLLHREPPVDHHGALAAYHKYLQLVEGSTETDKRTVQAAWSNVAVLQDQLGKGAESLASYEKALRASGLGLDPTDQVLVSGYMNVFEPANHMFWTWQPLQGTAKVLASEDAATVVETSEDMTDLIDRRHQIRIGEHHIMTVLAVKSGHEVEVADLLLGGSTGAGLEGELYRKIPTARLTPNIITTVFNLALLHEKQGRFDAAQELHKAILAEHPLYTSCYLRLGCIARDSGHISDAHKWFKQAIGLDPHNADALVYMADLHMRQEDWKEAQMELNNLKALDGFGNDPFMRIAQGNIYWANMEDTARYKANRHAAGDNYFRALQKDPSNAYAANGVGMVLAEKGYQDQAQEVFTRVREATGETMADAWLNLGHVFFIKKRYSEALKLYTNCLRKFHMGKDVSLHMHLGYAHCRAEQFDEALLVVRKAIHMAPDDARVWNNLAMCLEAAGMATLQQLEKNAEQQSLASAQGALDRLREAVRLLKWLRDFRPDAKPEMAYMFRDWDKLNHKHLQYLQGNLPACEQYVELARQREEDGRKAQAARQARLRADEEQAALERQAKQEEEAQRAQINQERMEARRREMAEIAQRLAQTQKAKEPREGPQRGGAKKGRRRNGGGDNMPVYDDDDQRSSSDEDIPDPGNGSDSDNEPPARNDDYSEDEGGRSPKRDQPKMARKTMAEVSGRGDWSDDDGIFKSDSEDAPPPPKADRQPSTPPVQKRKLSDAASDDIFGGSDSDGEHQPPAKVPGKEVQKRKLSDVAPDDIFGGSDSDGEHQPPAKLPRKEASSAMVESDEDA